jgi:hypothetical protein
MTHRPQFRLRSLFILTAIVAVGCLVGARVLLAFDLIEPVAALLMMVVFLCCTISVVGVFKGYGIEKRMVLLAAWLFGALMLLGLLGG